MTQNASDVEIDNQGFAAFRQDLNDVLEDITTLHSGNTAPTTTYANQWWYELDTDKLYIRNEDNDAWIEILTLDQANDHLATIGASITLDGTGNVSIDSGDFTVDTNTLHVDSTNNRVGVGTASPAQLLSVEQSSTSTVDTLVKNTGTGTSADARVMAFVSGASGGDPQLGIGVTGVQDYFWRIDNADSDKLKLDSNGTTRMTIDSSGNLLVGKSTTDVGTQGTRLDDTGRGFFTRSTGFCLQANRLSSDGEIMRFSKDGSTVGSIGSAVTFSGNLYIAGDSGLQFRGGDILPANSAGTYTDNQLDLGDAGGRFDDIFATNGTIQTSDQNEKQQVACLTAAEMTAAKAISALFKTFKWNDKVEAKGDAARTHTGVIAQEVQSAMTDAGLDATKYAFWCSDTWWETQTEVPAVEAVEAQDAVYDEDGNVVTEAVEAVEAQEAYTRTDTYETAEEAPEGATERTRLGIRYPELLAFVGAATEQRLADIEARLTALEN